MVQKILLIFYVQAIKEWLDAVGAGTADPELPESPEGKKASAVGKASSAKNKAENGKKVRTAAKTSPVRKSRNTSFEKGRAASHAEDAKKENS